MGALKEKLEMRPRRMPDRSSWGRRPRLLLVLLNLVLGACGASTSSLRKVERHVIERHPAARTTKPSLGVFEAPEGGVAVLVTTDCSEQATIEVTHHYDVTREPSMSMPLWVLLASAPAALGGMCFLERRDDATGLTTPLCPTPVAGAAFGTAGAVLLAALVDQLVAIDGSISQTRTESEAIKNRCPVAEAGVRIGSISKATDKDGSARFGRAELLGSSSPVGGLALRLPGATDFESGDGGMLLAHLERARTRSEEEKATAQAEHLDEARRRTQADRGQTDEESACRAVGATRAPDPGYFARSTRLSATSTPTADAPTRLIEAAAVLGNIVCSGTTWVVARTFDGPVFIQRSGLMDRREKKDDLLRLAKQEMKSGSSAEARQLLLRAAELDQTDTQPQTLFRANCRTSVQAALRGSRAARQRGHPDEGGVLLDEVADCIEEQRAVVANERVALQQAVERLEAAARREQVKTLVKDARTALGEHFAGDSTALERAGAFSEELVALGSGRVLLGHGTTAAGVACMVRGIRAMFECVDRCGLMPVCRTDTAKCVVRLVATEGTCPHECVHRVKRADFCQ